MSQIRPLTLFDLKKGTWKPRLPNDRLKRSDTQFGVVRHRHCNRGFRRALLHHDVTAALADLRETVTLQQLAKFSARENAQLSQPQPQFS
jgi:hypothetical protein